MKPVKILTALMLMLIATACQDEPDPSQSEKFQVYIHLQSQFESDRVQVFIDGRELIDQSVQTNLVIGFAFSSSSVQSAGRHLLKVVVNNVTTEATYFDVSHEQYIGVNYQPSTKAISFLYSDGPFLYD